MIAVDILRTLPLFAALDAEQLRFIAACASVQRLPRGTMVLAEGDPASGL
mgnify:FL=1